MENQRDYLGGNLPVSRYTFIIYHNPNDNETAYLGDGLEHASSTIILLYMPLDEQILRETVYGIASHEFFHTIMPIGLHSYEIENYDFINPEMSQHLWLYEGTTEYFSIHMPVKQGLQSPKQFAEVIERKIAHMKEFDNTIPLTTLRSCFKMEVGTSCKCLEFKTMLFLSFVLEKYGTKKSRSIGLQ